NVNCLIFESNGGTLYFPDIQGHALIRCFEYIQYEYPPDYDFTNSKIPGPDKTKSHDNHNNRKSHTVNNSSNIILPKRPPNLLQLNLNSSICAFYVVDTSPIINSEGVQYNSSRLV